MNPGDGDTADLISRRKLEHFDLALGPDMETPSGPGWDDVMLVHNCLPEIDVDAIDLGVSFLGHRLRAPVWITGMTGGHEKAALVNARLAVAAQRHGLAMGLGSQRAGLASAHLMRTYESAREAAPDAILIANIGAPQLIPQGSSLGLAVADIVRIIDSVAAQGLAIHLNFLQEVIQPEGDRAANGCLRAIAHVIRSVRVPVLAKETGAGVAREQALQLVAAGVSAIDVGGFGGTSMVRVEGRRADSAHGYSSLASSFDHWGIPTAASVVECRTCGVPVVATGGVRTGVDAARAIALGAQAVGVGRPFLAAALAGESELEDAIVSFLRELRVSMFLMGCSTVPQLGGARVVLRGDLLQWTQQRAL